MSEVLVAMIRDVTTMDDGRRITYYYSAPAGSATSADAETSPKEDEDQ
ncbi:hypothetical protein KIH74_17135 [Kineosporia sp. J2-2]|uniref:Uncharacterized protein n=1 Tax=Kineosporia corallincola TaxID=2835133 RepID=A0ABS5THU6_9ACTN|nr:hypothetical protein [Kineosporia corallincola]MBT0770671.1 hypothetical protein [Kineosporia corallincola]